MSVPVTEGAAFRAPPAYWPEPLTTARLARLWRMSYRLVSLLIDKGLLDGERTPDGYRVTHAAAAAFARDALRIREVKPDMIIRHPGWIGGVPLRVIEVRLVEGGTKWQLGTRGPSGDLVYAPLSAGDRIVLRVPAPSPSPDSARKDPA